jgi:uncharacterized protein YdaU (DUF1376 family)
VNYYPFHVGDYAAHTAHLEPMEDLAYRRLLDLYYLREGPLPADIQATAKLVRLRSCAADVESVLREFFTLTEAGWVHSRCDDEIERMQGKQAKARASAQASVNVRRANAQRSLPSEQANAQRSLPSEQANVELPTPTPTPTPTPKQPSVVARGSRLAEDWVLPKPWGQWALAEQPTWTAEHCRKVGASFADFWQAKAGKDAVKLDWEKTWHGWVRKEGPMRVNGYAQSTVPSPSVSPGIAQTQALMAAQEISPEQRERNAQRAREIRAAIPDLRTAP